MVQPEPKLKFNPKGNTSLAGVFSSYFKGEDMKQDFCTVCDNKLKLSKLNFLNQCADCSVDSNTEVVVNIIDDYVKLPLKAQRALDQFWFAAEDMKNNDDENLVSYFYRARRNLYQVFSDLTIDVSSFVHQ